MAQLKRKTSLWNDVQMTIAYVAYGSLQQGTKPYKKLHNFCPKCPLLNELASHVHGQSFNVQMHTIFQNWM